MKIDLKYGTAGITVDAPETPGFLGILSPSEPAPLEDPGARISASLLSPTESEPLAKIAHGKKSACIVVSDITRPVPNTVILPPILRTLEEAGVPPGNVLILIATGIHRPSSPEETVKLVGAEIARKYRVEDHFSRRAEDMAEVGRIGGVVPALVNRKYVDAELKILTGFIEPHMWAGYSGGRKSILPGISSIDTLKFMHGPEMVAHPSSGYGLLEGNPFHEAGLWVMARAGADFMVNVTLDTHKRVTGVFSGHPVKAHLEGCAFLARHAVRELDRPLDFIVTTNAGAPLDINLYQTVKGMTGAAPAVKPGGDILIVSRCAEGAGSEEYKNLLDSVDSPRAFLDRLMRKEFFVPDQWCAQETYKVVSERNVWIYTEGLSREDLIRYHFTPVDDPGAAILKLLEKHGPLARWAAVPDGPMLVLKIKGD